MRRLLAALLLTVSLLVPASASALSIQTDTQTLTAIAEWAGCKNVLVADVTESGGFGFNAYFGVNTYTGQPVIVIINGHEIPEQHRFTVFLHELGHCLQYMDGSIFRMDTVTRELEADARAVQLACALHMDGPRMLRELWDWANAEFGYEGDPDHGTLAQRIEQANNGRSYCPNVQAPFQMWRTI
jgi:hypothetical protein